MAPEDFFDDEWEEPSRTQETAPTRKIDEGDKPTSRPSVPPAGEEPPPRRPRTTSRGGAGGGGRPTLRKPASMENLEVGRLAMVAGAVLVAVIVLVLLVRSCGGDETSSKNQDYADAVGASLDLSDQASQRLQSMFRSPRPLKAAAAQRQVQEARELAEQALATAREITPTDEAEPHHSAVLMALSYRINGLECIERALPQAYREQQASAGGKLLVPCTQRLLASDVVYADSYAAQVNNALADANVDARVATSVFLPSQLEATVTPAGMGLVLQRLKPGSSASGLHGLSLDTVIAQSDGKSVTLRPGGDINQVQASTDLVFVITATNGGNFQEFDIPVMVTLGSGQDAPSETVTIDQVGPGDTATVEVSGLTADSTALDFGKEVKLTVAVQPVPGERTTSNNRATYTIAFTLAL